MSVNSGLKATKIIGHVWVFSSKYWMFIHIYGVPVVFRKLRLLSFPFSYLKKY